MLSRRCSSAAASPHNVLNAKHHEREARDHQGRRPAGRRHHRHQHGRPRRRHQARRGRASRPAACTCSAPSATRAARIDNQLRGRSGRQGDPGETRFYLSPEDELIRLFAGDRMYRILEPARARRGRAASRPRCSAASVERAQKKVEELNFQRRKNVLEYDDVMNKQRAVIYDQRSRILEGEDFGEQVREMIERASSTTSCAGALDGSSTREDWDLDSLFVGLRSLYDPASRRADIDVASTTVDEVAELAVDDALDAVRRAREAHRRGADAQRGARRDAAGHRRALEGPPARHGLPAGGHPPAGSGPARPAGRSTSARASTSSRTCSDGIKQQRRHHPAQERARGPRVLRRHRRSSEPRRAVQLHERRRPGLPDVVHRRGRRPPASRPTESDAERRRRTWRAQAQARAGRAAHRGVGAAAVVEKVGRNDPCPCGSGKKYKKCHGA